MKKVLVTGASGFIGRYALPFLIKNGYEVHAVYNTARIDSKENKKLVWHQCNLLDSEKQKRLLSEIKPSHLLHFAWYAVPGKYWTSPENLCWVQASLELLRNFVDQKGKRAVVVGTCAEYDWSYGFCSEFNTPINPFTLYGICKSSLQKMVEHFAKQTGISQGWGRIFFLYGPYEAPERLVSSVIISLLQNKTAKCSRGNQVRDFLYVQDVAEALVGLLDSDVQGPVNIASGQPVSLKRVIYQIAEELGRQELVEMSALPARENDPPLLVADVRRLTDEVGWIPKITLEKGLSDAIRWWKQNLKDD